MMELDHLAIVCARLEEGAAWASERLGVPLESGGRHETFGTWNRLLSLGPGLYLEVIAPEPGRAPDRPRWFGLDDVREPRLGNWIVRVADMAAALAAAPAAAGRPLDLSRGPFAWTVLVPPDGSLPWGGAFPTLIRWREGRSPPYGRGVTFSALGEIVKAEAGVLEALVDPAEWDAREHAAALQEMFHLVREQCEILRIVVRIERNDLDRCLQQHTPIGIAAAMGAGDALQRGEDFFQVTHDLVTIQRHDRCPNERE